MSRQHRTKEITRRGAKGHDIDETGVDLIDMVATAVVCVKEINNLLRRATIFEIDEDVATSVTRMELGRSISDLCEC